MKVTIPKSTVDGIIAPAIPVGAAATSLAMQFQLEQSQWWSPEKMQEYQYSQLTNLYQHAWRTVPFYRQRFEKAGLKEETIISADVLHCMPVLSREEIQAAGDDLYSTSVPEKHGKVKIGKTSGSTGQPMRYGITEITDFFWRAFTLRDHLWQQRDFSACLAAIRAQSGDTAMPPDGVTFQSWGPATDIIYDTGLAALLNSTASIADQADWLCQINPVYLLTHPSNLLALAEYFHNEGRSLPTLKEVRTVGEPVTEKLRHACQEAWGVPLVDFYTSREVGYIALQCPENEYYHVQSENAYIEILNDLDEPCRPGEVGRVVATPLHNFASPLFRYATGDYARVGDKCSCGRGLPVITEILGRERNMIVLPDSSSHWPHFGHANCGDIANIRQFQAIQHSPVQIEIRLVVENPLDSNQEARLRDHFNNNLGYSFEMQFSYLDHIPRSQNGKYEEFICNI